MLLENKFWRMVAGKEPLLPGSIGRFVTDLLKVVKVTIKRYGPCGSIIAAELAIISVERHCQDLSLPETYCDIQRELNIFFGNSIWGGSVLDAVDSKDISSKYRPCLNWRKRELRYFNAHFAWKFWHAMTDGADDLIFRNLTPPSVEMSEIPRKYWTPRMRFWEELVSDPVEWSVHKIWNEIETLKLQGSSKKNLAEIEQLETKVFGLANRSRPYLGSSEEEKETARKLAENNWKAVVEALHGFIDATNQDLDVFIETSKSEPVQINGTLH